MRLGSQTVGAVAERASGLTLRSFVSRMSFVSGLVSDARLARIPLVASLIVIVGFLLGRRVFHGVRRLRGVATRLLILGGSPLARRVVEEIEQRPHRRLVDVVDRQGVAGVEQLVRHWLAHGADAQISCFHGERPAQRCGSTMTVPTLPPRSTALWAPAVSYSGKRPATEKDSARRRRPGGDVGLRPPPVHMWHPG